MTKKIIFKCEVITPMFFAGADGKTPEFRAPSIKGAMRFWWRAMNGHLDVADLREVNLRKKEAEIFGGSGDNGGKSKFAIKIKYNKGANSSISKYRVLPHSTNKTFTNPAIRPGTNFTVVLQLQRDDSALKKQLENLFIIVSLLGGLGRRARRGFGAFKINEINGSNLSYNNLCLDDIAKRMNIVSCGAEPFSVVGNSIVSNFNLGHFPYIKEIKFGIDRSHNNYYDLLKQIGEASHKYNSYFTGFGGREGRLASPVYVSVVKKNSKFFPVVTILEAISKKLDAEGSNKDRSQDFIREVLSYERA